MLRVFVKKGCGVCKNVLSQLKQRGVEFEQIDVETKEGWDLAEKLKIRAAGVIIDENDNRVELKNL